MTCLNFPILNFFFVWNIKRKFKWFSSQFFSIELPPWYVAEPLILLPPADQAVLLGEQLLPEGAEGEHRLDLQLGDPSLETTELCKNIPAKF